MSMVKLWTTEQLKEHLRDNRSFTKQMSNIEYDIWREVKAELKRRTQKEKVLTDIFNNDPYNILRV